MAIERGMLQNLIFDNLALTECALVRDVADLNPTAGFIFRVFSPDAFKLTLNAHAVTEEP